MNILIIAALIRIAFWPPVKPYHIYVYIYMYIDTVHAYTTPDRQLSDQSMLFGDWWRGAGCRKAEQGSLT